MESKIFEVRDRATCIQVMATRMGSKNPRESKLTWAAGISSHIQSNFVLLTKLNDGMICKSTLDPFDWRHLSNGRTMEVAHRHIAENFDSLSPGAVVDVEFVLGEVNSPKESQYA